MPKQDKEKAKMWYFGFLDAARFTRSEQAGNPLFCSTIFKRIFRQGVSIYYDFAKKYVIIVMYNFR